VWYFHIVFRFVFVCSVLWVEFQRCCWITPKVALPVETAPWSDFAQLSVAHVHTQGNTEGVT
jgi:hypothetical protein